jgi:autotransporter-associated beta strand protein
VTEGVLVLGDDGGLGSGRVLLNGGTIKADAAGQTRRFVNDVVVGADSGFAGGNGRLESAGNVDLGGAQRSLAVEGDVVFIGMVRNGGLIKQGTGTLTLTSALNSYSGGTIIRQGALALGANDGSALGSGGVIIDGGVFSTGMAAGGDVRLHGLVIDSGGISGERNVVTSGTIRATGEVLPR